MAPMGAGVWERRALDHVADGRAAEAVAAYQQHGRIHTAPTSEQTRTRLVEDWWQRHAGGEDAIILAHRRTDVAQLNQLARRKAQAAGRLRGPQLELPGGAFAAGDLVVIKRNDHQHAVTNGDRGQITHVDVDHQRLTIRIDNRQVELDRGFLLDTTRQGGPTLQHGYALTCHVAQGLTVDSAFLLADTGLSKELAYTALSRGRKTNHLYLTEQPDRAQAEYAPVEPARGPLDRLTTMLATGSAQQLASELDPAAAVREAETRLQRASRERRDIEASSVDAEDAGNGWPPRRRREAAAAEELAQTRRSLEERRHGERPFVTERELEQRRESRSSG